ncbi:hypothetical protein V5O48_013869, partial [Marasmius crinis-equi]
MLSKILFSHAPLLLRLDCLRIDESLKLIVLDDGDDNDHRNSSISPLLFSSSSTLGPEPWQRGIQDGADDTYRSEPSFSSFEFPTFKAESNLAEPAFPPNFTFLSDNSRQQQDQKRDPATPLEGDPVVSRPTGAESPASPADGNSTSPTAEERSSSLSPVPENGSHAEQNADADNKSAEDRIPSRVSTPLSELSPPPDDMDTPAADPAEPSEKKDQSEGNGDDENTAKQQPEVNGVSSSKPPNSSSQQPSASGLGGEGGSEAHSQHPPLMNHSPMPDAISSGPTQTNEQKVGMMLELNAELLKVSMEFQARGIPLTDSRFQQYGNRIQSNLDYMARWADSKPTNPSALPPLPIVDAPPPVDFVSTD